MEQNGFSVKLYGKKSRLFGQKFASYLINRCQNMMFFDESLICSYRTKVGMEYHFFAYHVEQNKLCYSRPKKNLFFCTKIYNFFEYSVSKFGFFWRLIERIHLCWANKPACYHKHNRTSKEGFTGGSTSGWMSWRHEWHWMENSGRLSDIRKTNDYRSYIYQQAEAGTKHTRWI